MRQGKKLKCVCMHVRVCLCVFVCLCERWSKILGKSSTIRNNIIKCLSLPCTFLFQQLRANIRRAREVAEDAQHLQHHVHVVAQQMRPQQV